MRPMPSGSASGACSWNAATHGISYWLATMRPCQAVSRLLVKTMSGRNSSTMRSRSACSANSICSHGSLSSANS